jgi:hypothetical protein
MALVAARLRCGIALGPRGSRRMLNPALPEPGFDGRGVRAQFAPDHSLGELR